MVVAHARRWLGTPVRHRGRQRGIEVDCVGLVLEVGIAAGVLDRPAALAKEFTTYGLLPNPASMRKALEAYMTGPVDFALPGDVGFFRMPGCPHPMHLAIFSAFEGRLMLIHAHAGQRPAVVVEAGYSAGWPERLDSIWRYPGIS